MAKKNNSMVLVGKATYANKDLRVKKGEVISLKQYDALPDEHKQFFTDPETAAKVLKRKVLVEPQYEEGEVVTEQGGAE